MSSGGGKPENPSEGELANKNNAGNANKSRKKRRKNKKKTSGVNGGVVHKQQGIQGGGGGGGKSKRNRGGGPLGQPPLHLPHAKVTLRNVCDFGRHGTALDMTQLLKSIIDKFNDSIPSLSSTTEDGLSTENSGSGAGNALSSTIENVVPFVPIQIDEMSFERALIPRATHEISEENDPTDDIADKIDDTLDEKPENDSKCEELKESEKSSTVQNELTKNGEDDITSKINNMKLDDDPKEKEEDHAEPPKHGVSLRLMYVVPAKNSRRRGEKPGRAYFVLNPPMPTTSKTSDKILFGDGVKNDAKSMNLNPVLTSSERSRVIAKSRLLLKRTISRLSDICKSDASTAQTFGKCRIEFSLSQKTWKAENLAVSNLKNVGPKRGGHGYGHYFAKYDSTIDQSDDFKTFMETTINMKEMLLNRPKPVPGGGGVNVDTGTSNRVGDDGKSNKDNISGLNTNVTSNLQSEDGQPLPAIVIHLREKALLKKKSKNSGGSKKGASGANTSNNVSGTSADLQKKSKGGKSLHGSAKVSNDKMSVGKKKLVKNNSGVSNIKKIDKKGKKKNESKADTDRNDEKKKLSNTDIANKVVSHKRNSGSHKSKSGKQKNAFHMSQPPKILKKTN
eukprot:CAMPEP_0184855292 /NCGR_PEP_ID=MMETSP0580-20130426/581_1 /TAXON_ID=1118495 /ORGANISM="Dactyliosolen fragilissimus" /LENGTH=619 /DNA_ID=CAMNT_0027349767 /DNA_START=136 /DNA_END=1995 /DNA_ORIENTATION=-